MNAQQAADYLARHVRLGHGGFDSWGATCHFSAFADTLTMAVNFLRLPHRDTGRPEPLTVTFDFTGRQLEHWNERRLISEFRHMLIYFVEHEVDECVMVDGVRAFDPHLPSMPPAKLPEIEPELAAQVNEECTAADAEIMQALERDLVYGKPVTSVIVDEAGDLPKLPKSIYDEMMALAKDFDWGRSFKRGKP